MMIDIFNNRVEEKPRLIYFPHDADTLFPDDPDQYRWRATWDDWFPENPTGIILMPYPVLKKTKHGAWIDHHAYWSGEWVLTGHKRFVVDGSNSSWAKLTKEAAIYSLAHRLVGWSSNVAKAHKRVVAASHALWTLFPEHTNFAKAALAHLESAR